MTVSIESLRANSILMDQIEDMKFDQQGKNRNNYDQIVLEAIVSPEGQSILLDKLYKETQKIDGVDFGNIPDTRGDITKFRYYGQLNDCIELINEIVADDSTPNIQTMNRLQQILLDARPDFEFGFKADNYIITNMYKVMALSLFEIENVCIVDATEYLRKRMSISTNPKTMTKVRSVVKNANQFVKMYENGQWSTMIKAFKSGKAYEFAVLHADDMDPATEDFEFNARIGSLRDVVDSGTRAVKDGPGAVKNAINLITQTAKNAYSSHKGLSIAAGVIGIIIMALMIIRVAVSLFYRGAGNLKKWAKTNAEILKANLKIGNNSEDAITSQKKLLDTLENTADAIEYNVFKSEKEAAADLAKSNRENYSPADFKNINATDFEF